MYQEPELLPPGRTRGRAAVSNAASRFDRHARHAFDDGWSTIEEAGPGPRTTVEPDASRTVIARNSSPDVPFDRAINPYRGCEHGCIY
ncbi:MAG: radical SAM protein, partial [Alphaproteobacteria bacterium]